MTADVLDAVCNYCSDPDNNLWIDTVANVAAWIRQQRGISANHEEEED